MKRKKTSGESRHLGLVKQLPCATCDAPEGSEAHHVREQGGRIGDYMTIPLCSDCHRGPLGVHGDKTMLRIAKATELQLVNDTLATLYW